MRSRCIVLCCALVSLAAQLVFFTTPYRQDFSTFKPGDRWRNYANTVTCTPRNFYQPIDEDEIRTILMRLSEEKQNLRVVGSGHSYSNLVCGENILLMNLDKMSSLLSVDKTTKQATAQAGIKI